MLSILNDIWDAIIAIYNFIFSTIGGFITVIIDFIKGFIRAMENTFKSLEDLFIDFIDFIKYIFNFLSNCIDSVIDFLKDFLPILIDKFTETFTAYFHLGMDTCEYCFEQLTSVFTSQVGILASSNVISQTAYYCLYMSDFSGALTIISCGVLILLGRKMLAIITFGFIKI
jgi:hypothetical protein